MQGDRRLSGAGAPGDDQRPVVGGPDGFILLTLDGRHDVGHAASALAADRGKERAVTDHDRAVEDVPGRRVEQFVIDADDPVTAAGDAASAYDALRVSRGRPIERGCRRRAPVHHDRLLAVGAQPHPPDVVNSPIIEVESTEQQTLPGQVEVGSTVGGGLRRDVPFVDRLR